MTLRSRLLFALGAVIALLLIAGYVLFRVQSATLLQQVDSRFDSLRRPAMSAAALAPLTPNDPPDAPNARGQRSLADLYVGRLEANGVMMTVGTPESDPGTTPVLKPGRSYAAPTTVETTGGSGERMRVVAFPGPMGASAVVGQSLADVDAASATLARNLLGIGALLLGVIALVFWWMVRLGLRPIAEVTGVARAIGAGDTTQRVPAFPEGTEAQELGQAFNRLVEENEVAQARLRQFVADASHELRTPLATLSGYAALRAAGGLSDPASVDDAMRRIRQEALRMGGLVDDLLLLAEIDRGPDFRRDRVDLVAVVAGLVSDARAIDPSRAFDLDGPTEAAVAGDANRLTQVVGALLDNARKHTPAGCDVQVRMLERGDCWRVEVADHGPGLSAEDAAHVFDRFYRADAARARATGGSGLGLAIASGIVAAHQGRIGVESTLGQGCTFWVELPRAVAASGTLDA